MISSTEKFLTDNGSASRWIKHTLERLDNKDVDFLFLNKCIETINENWDLLDKTNELEKLCKKLEYAAGNSNQGLAQKIRILADQRFHPDAYRKKQIKLEKAISQGNLDEVIYLIKNDANPLDKDLQIKGSLLHIAIQRNNIELVKVLIKSGANPYTKDVSGKSPLELAREFHRTAIIDFLLASDSIFMHLHGDAFAEKTSFEGYSSTGFLEFINAYLLEHPLENPEANQHIQRLIKSALEISEMQNKGTPLTDILKLQLKKEKTVLVDGGWIDTKGGHAIYYEIGKQENGAFFFRLYNRGAGWNYHDSVINTEENFVYRKRPAFVEIKDISEEKLFDRDTLNLLTEYVFAQQRSLKDYQYSDKDIYEVFLPLLGGVRSPSNAMMEELMGPQHSGTCAWKSISALLKNNLGHECYKRFKHDLKRDTLGPYIINHLGSPEFQPHTQLWNQCEKALEKFSRMVNNLHDAKIIGSDTFKEDLAFIQELQQRMSQRKQQALLQNKDRCARLIDHPDVNLEKAKGALGKYSQKTIVPTTTPLTKPIDSSLFDRMHALEIPASPEDFETLMAALKNDFSTQFKASNFDDVVYAYEALMEKLFSAIHEEMGNLEHFQLNLETAVQDDKVMQDFDSESILMGGDHSLKVKPPPIKSDYGSKDCVNLSSSTAVSRLNEAAAIHLSDMHDLYFKSCYGATEPENHTADKIMLSLFSTALILQPLRKSLGPADGIIRSVMSELGPTIKEAWTPAYQTRLAAKIQQSLKACIDDNNKYSFSKLRRSNPTDYALDVTFVLELIKSEGFTEKARAKHQGYPISGSCYEQAAFLLNSWDEELLGREFIALRRQVLQSSALINSLPVYSKTIPMTPIMADDLFSSKVFITSITPDSKVNVLFGSRDWVKDKDYSKNIFTISGFFYDRFKHGHKQIDNPAFLKLTKPTAALEGHALSRKQPASESLSVDEIYDLQYLHMISPDLSQFYLERFLKYFKTNISKLSDTKFQILFEKGIAEVTYFGESYLLQYIQERDGGVEALADFLREAYHHFKEKNCLDAMVFFLRMNHLASDFAKEASFMNTTEELIKLMAKPEAYTSEENTLLAYVFLATVDLENGIPEGSIPSVLAAMVEVSKNALSTEFDHPAIRRGVRKNIHQMQNALRLVFENQPDKALNQVASHYLGEESKLTWTGSWPFYETQYRENKIVVDASQALMHSEEGTFVGVPPQIRNHPLYKNLFDGTERVIQIGMGTYQLLSQDGLQFRIQLQGQELVVQKFFQDNWYTFHERNENGLTYKPLLSEENYTFWENPAQSEILVFDNKGDLRFAEVIEGNKTSLLRKPEGFIQLDLQKTPFHFLSRLASDDHFAVWGTGEGKKTKILSWECGGLSLSFHPVEAKGTDRIRWESDQHPGFFLKENQYVSPLIDQGIQDYLLLENSRGLEKVLIPRKNFMDIDLKNLPEDGRCMLYELELNPATRKRQLKSSSPEAGFYLAYRMMLTKSTPGYEIAQQLLDISQASITRPDEEVLEILDWILALQKTEGDLEKKNTPYIRQPDHDVRGVALRLKAQALRLEMIQRSSSNEQGGSPTWPKTLQLIGEAYNYDTRPNLILKDFKEYINKYGNVGFFQLSLAEETLLIEYLGGLKLSWDVDMARFAQLRALETKRLDLKPLPLPSISIKTGIEVNQKDFSLLTSASQDSFKASSLKYPSSRPTRAAALEHFIEAIRLARSIKNGGKTLQTERKNSQLTEFVTYGRMSNDSVVRMLLAAIDEVISHPEEADYEGPLSAHRIEGFMSVAVIPCLHRYIQREQTIIQEIPVMQKDLKEKIKQKSISTKASPPILSKHLLQNETTFPIVQAIEGYIHDFIINVPIEVTDSQPEGIFNTLLDNLIRKTEQSIHAAPIQRELKRIGKDKNAFYDKLRSQAQTRPSISPERADELLDFLNAKICEETGILAEQEAAIMHLVEQKELSFDKDVIAWVGQTKKLHSFEEILMSFARNELDAELAGLVQEYLIRATQTQVFLRSSILLSDLENPSRLMNAAAELTKDNVSEEPKYLVLQYLQNILVRSDQKQDIDRLLADSPLIIQKIMGSGKTSVLMTMLALLRADGENISVLMIPQQLMPTAAKELQDKLGPAYGQRIHPLHFDRSTSFELDNLKRINALLEDVKQNRDCLITSPESIHCLQLKFFEYCHQHLHGACNEEQFDLVIQIYNQLRENGVVLMDEVDLQLNCRLDVNFPMGEGKSIPADELSLITELYSILVESEEIRALIKNEFAPNIALNDAPLFSEDTYRKRILPILVKELIKKYPDEITEEWLLQIDSDSASLTLNDTRKSFWVLAKEELHTFLPLALEKRCDEHYGFSEKNMSGLAICYRNGKPLEGIYFANPHLTANYTLQTILKHGISEPIVKNILSDCIRELDKQVDENGAVNKNSEAYLTFAEIAGSDYIDRIFKLHPKDFKKITRQLNSNASTQLSFAKKYILPQITQHSKKFNGNAQTLIYPFKTVQGFSGTLSNRDTFHQKLMSEPDLGTDSKTIHLLLNMQSKGKSQVTILEKGSIDDLAKVMHSFNETGKNLKAIIDTGGYLVDVSQEEIHKKLQDQGIFNMVCHNNEHELIYYEKGKAAVAFSNSRTHPNERFTIYRQPYATGTDVKQSPDAAALVTIGRYILLRDLLQSVCRMRGIETGQTVQFIVEKDVEKIIRETLQLDGGISIEVQHIIEFAILNQCKQCAEDNYMSLKQKFQNVIIERIKEHLLANSASPQDVLKRYTPEIDEFLLPFSAETALEQYGGKEVLLERDVVINNLIEEYHQKYKNLHLGGSIKKELKSLVRKELLADKLSSRKDDNTNQVVEIQQDLHKDFQKDVQKETIKHIEEGSVVWDYKDWEKGAPLIVKNKEDFTNNYAHFYPLKLFLESNPSLRAISEGFNDKILVSSNFAPLIPRSSRESIHQPFRQGEKQINYLTCVKKDEEVYLCLVDMTEVQKFRFEGYPICIFNSPISADKAWTQYDDPHLANCDMDYFKELPELMTQIEIFAGQVPKSSEQKERYRNWLKNKDIEDLKQLFLENIWANNPRKEMYWKKIKELRNISDSLSYFEDK